MLSKSIGGGARIRKATCSVSVLLACISSNSMAQMIDEIVVTGSVMQNMDEIQTRRESFSIVDSLSQDDIGDLPDLTIADSMRRIAGVSTLNNDDIGQFASVRGVDPDLVPVTLNGLTLASIADMGGGNRRTNLQVIPGRAVKQLQVFKSFTPDQESGAVGGYINLVPVSAFDRRSRKLLINPYTSYSTYMDVPDDNSDGASKDSPWGGGLNVSFSDTFGADNQFGLVLNGTWSVRPRTQSNITRPFRLYFNDAGKKTTPESADWNGHSMPDEYQALSYTNQFENYGGSARFEYKPNADYYTSVFAYAYFADEEETRNLNGLAGFEDPQNQTAAGGNVLNKHATTQWRYNPFERDSLGIQWENKLYLGDKGKLDVKAGYSYASFMSDRRLVAFRYNANKRMDYRITSDRDAEFTLTDPEDYVNPANYGMFNAYNDWRDSESDVIDTRIDYTFNSEADDRGWGFGLGLAYREMDLERDVTMWRYKRDMGISLEGQSFIPNFEPPGYAYPVLWIDQEKFWNETIPQQAELNEAVSEEESLINDYQYSEEILNAYASVTYATDNWRLIGGLRWDHTDHEATMAQVVGGELQDELQTTKGDYSELLPYFSGRVALTDTDIIKFGVSKTLGRPNPSDIARVETVDEDDFTISRGNSGLKPRRSTNLNLGYEKFFDNGDGMFTASVFYKEVKDDIITVGRAQNIGGARWTVDQPINGETTKYKGLELGVVSNSFRTLSPALENLGASANLSYVDGSTSYIFQGERRDRDDLLNQMKLVGNLAFFYDLGKGSEIRLIYNYQGEYVDTYGAVPWEDVSNDSFDTVDLSIKWNVSPDWRVQLQGRNIFSNNRNRLTGPDQEWNRAEIEVGSTWSLHAVYSF